MTGQSIIRLYVEEIAAQAAEITRLKATLAASEQTLKDAQTLAAGYRAEAEQIRAELTARLAVAEEGGR